MTGIWGQTQIKPLITTAFPVVDVMLQAYNTQLNYILSVRPIDINTSGLLARLQRALSKMAGVWECLLMKLTADQFYFVYFCMFEEPAMFQPFSYSSEFVSIRPPLVLSTDNGSFNAKNIRARRAGSPDLFMSMVRPLSYTKIIISSTLVEF